MKLDQQFSHAKVAERYFLGANVDMHMSHQSLVELVPNLVFGWLAIISIHEQVCLIQTYTPSVGNYPAFCVWSKSKNIKFDQTYW
jgi:hypothetical protein